MKCAKCGKDATSNMNKKVNRRIKNMEERIDVLEDIRIEQINSQLIKRWDDGQDN